MALYASVVKLVEAIGACSRVNGTFLYMATLLMVWNAKKCAGGAVVMSISTSQLWPFVVQTSVVSVVWGESFTQAVQFEKHVLVLKPRLTEVSY